MGGTGVRIAAAVLVVGVVFSTRTVNTADTDIQSQRSTVSATLASTPRAFTKNAGLWPDSVLF
jgi:hypothetical protein